MQSTERRKEQRTPAITRALPANSKLVLVDEPSGWLAPLIIQTVGNIVLKIRQEALSILHAGQSVSLTPRGGAITSTSSAKAGPPLEREKDELARDARLKAEDMGVSNYGRGVRGRDIGPQQSPTACKMKR